jgi:hypothetical protein
MFSSNHPLEIGLLALLEVPHSHFYLSFWREVMLLIACVPMVYYVVATLAAVRFFSKERTKPGSYTPPVSVFQASARCGRASCTVF